MQSSVSALDTHARVTDTVLLSFLINGFDTKMKVWYSELHGFGSTEDEDRDIQRAAIETFLSS